MNRTGKGGFRPGRSGNPGGRPKVAEKVREMARKHGPAAIRTLARIMARGKSESARMTAAGMLLDRGYGKASASLDVNLLLRRKLNELTLDELVELERQIVATGGADERE